MHISLPLPPLFLPPLFFVSLFHFANHSTAHPKEVDAIRPPPPSPGRMAFAHIGAKSVPLTATDARAHSGANSLSLADTDAAAFSGANSDPLAASNNLQ